MNCQLCIGHPFKDVFAIDKTCGDLVVFLFCVGQTECICTEDARI